MNRIERHKKLLQFSLDMLDSTLAKGILSNPRAVAFAASSGSVDLLSILLLKKGKISMGKVVNHQWFKKPMPGQKKVPIYEERIGVDFQRKEEIYRLMCDIEEKRNILAYGNPQEDDIEKVVIQFQKLKKTIEEVADEKLG